MTYKLLDDHDWFDKSLSYAASTLASKKITSLDAICKKALEALDDMNFWYIAMHEDCEENYEETITKNDFIYTKDMIEFAKDWITALQQGMLHKNSYDEFVIAERKAVRYDCEKRKIIWRKTKSFVKTSN